MSDYFYGHNYSIPLCTGSSIGFACAPNFLTMYCPDGLIDIESAFYGIYSNPCNTTCCLQSEGDCGESVEETAPLDWAYLLDTCQNKSFCQVPNRGRALESCGGVENADYVSVTFNCGEGM